MGRDENSVTWEGVCAGLDRSVSSWNGRVDVGGKRRDLLV